MLWGAEEQKLLMVETKHSGCLVSGVKQMLSLFPSTPSPLGCHLSHRAAAAWSQHLAAQKAVIVAAEREVEGEC